MGFQNPPVPWRHLEQAMSGRVGRDGRRPGTESWNGGGDGPGWGRRRQPFEAPALVRQEAAVPYAELHCHSNFSFLDGASHPEELVTEAARLGLEALALTDHHGLYGAVRFAEAARTVGLPTVFGTEITLADGAPGHTLGGGGSGRAVRSEAETTTQVATGRARHHSAPDPPGRHLLVVADGVDGYARLARALSLGHLAGEKEAPTFTLGDVADVVAGHGWVLTGCRKGTVPAALVADGPAAARRELRRLIEAFGRDRVLVELWDHGDPLDVPRNDALVELAAGERLEVVATNNVHYATPRQRPLAAALAAVRARRDLDGLAPWLPPAASAHLRSGAEQARRFARYPGAVEAAAEVGRAAAFDLALVAPRLPPFPCPDGFGEMAYLRHLVEARGGDRYGSRETERVAGAWAQIDHELAVIDELGYAGYFLVVWEIGEFCRDNDIFCQGRGSAANSAVCFALGITNVDAVSLGLLFERFLSAARDGPPDIDIDIESGRREEVIQHVYHRYGRHHTALVANVITYRARSAIRDMARALGASPGQQDAWAKRVDGWGSMATTTTDPDSGIPEAVLDLASQVEGAPRHLGIHPGGMVICDRPIIEVCPVEWARMDKRSVLQWDKDDCAAIGLVKFDLLGLGMLTALHHMVDLAAEHRGHRIDLGQLPQKDAVYAMLARADTVGVFQVESRAQMATLPRLQPSEFYDLVVEVALIRPGPIQGGAVHPYIRRRNKLEDPTYPHHLAKEALKKTYGVVLFQEQVMQLAIDVAGFSPAEADELRQAMGAKRSTARMEQLKDRLYAGMAHNDITGKVADDLYNTMAAFAGFGFPESHAVSFAQLVYSSAWFKTYEPAAFYGGLLNAQPMGFWSPATLCEDARRHDVEVLRPDLATSEATATLERSGRSHGGLAVRLGLGSIRTLDDEAAERITTERDAHGPYRGVEELARRVPSLTAAQLEALATAAAFESTGLERRDALWAVGRAVAARGDRLAGTTTGTTAPRLPGMTPVDETIADLWATGVAPDGHPTRFLRERLTGLGVVPIADLVTVDHGDRVLVAGYVTHRQRPMTANGTTFLSIEDETGLGNVVVSPGCWARHRPIAQGASALVIRGRVERQGIVVNVVADQLTHLATPTGLTRRSRDYR